jgi:hypothetical protein
MIWPREVHSARNYLRVVLKFDIRDGPGKDMYLRLCPHVLNPC